MIDQIVDVDVSTEMEGSFLEYAYSVIYARALPDARDGLKPVQRRIVYLMHQMGLRPDRAYVKSSRVVGEVMGKLHPHGDQAIYDTLVRLAQDFNLRLPLVDGHGNFGSLDDGPAAARYTEARLAPAALAMAADIDQDTVDFVPNYDNKLMQPGVLPAAIPQLLVNGAAGIAVGMATNMAPHNLVEVLSAARHLLAHPEATVEDLMRFIPGPDLPSGGKIVGLDGVTQAYTTGKGSFRTRASARIEKVSARRQGIVVTELPYMVGAERVIEKIKDGVNAKRLEGITAVADLTDRRHGMRLVIEVKNGFDPERVLELLYRHTPLEESFSINNVALVDGQPRTLGLKDLLQVWVDHRLEVVRRRCEHQLQSKRDRLHLVDGLLVAIVDIDDVIQIIRSSDDAASAQERLMSAFDLSQVQAEYLLELRLRRLTKFSTIELETEKAQLLAQIAELEEILSSRDVLASVVGREMDQVAAAHGTPRRTILLAEAAQAPANRAEPASSLEIADTPCWVMMSGTGLVARTVDATAPRREGRRSPHDVVISTVETTTRADVGVVTSLGRLVRLSVLDLPALAATDEPPSLGGGSPIQELVSLSPGEQARAVVSLSTAVPLAVATEQGVIKRLTPGGALTKDSWEIIALKDDDRVVGAAAAPDDAAFVFISSDAQLLTFGASAVRPQGRSGAGVAGMRLNPQAQVISFSALTSADDAVVVTIAGPSGALPGTTPGSAKVSPLSEFPPKGRATGGVRAHRFVRGEDHLMSAWAGPTPVRAMSSAGQEIALPDEPGKRDGSGVALSAPVHTLG